MNHPILKNEDDASSKYEIEASVRELSTMLGETVSSFAYPNGIPGMDFDDREVRLLVASGIRMGFTTEARSLHQEDDRLRIPRIAVSDRERVGSMRARTPPRCGVEQAEDRRPKRRILRKAAVGPHAPRFSSSSGCNL